MASVGLLIWGPEFGLQWCWGVPCDIKADLVTVSGCSAGFGYALWPKEFPCSPNKGTARFEKTNLPVKECPLLAGRCVEMTMKYGQSEISYFYMALGQAFK